MSISDHLDVIAAEKQSGADIAGARKGDLDDGEVILDAVIFSDGSLLNGDVPQVLQSMKYMLADHRTNIVRRQEVGMKKFEANDRLLTFAFPSWFMFGSGIKRPCGVLEADTRHMLLQYDNRFAEARDFCLLLFNQKFRHIALRSVRDSTYANPKRMKAFETPMNTPNLEEDLKKVSLLNALGITVEQSLLALQMFPHGHEDGPETWLKNDFFSPPNRPPRGTTARHPPCSPPICISLMAQSLWKNNGPGWKHLRGRPTDILSFEDDRLENRPKTAIFGHKKTHRIG